MPTASASWGLEVVARIAERMTLCNSRGVHCARHCTPGSCFVYYCIHLLHSVSVMCSWSSLTESCCVVAHLSCTAPACCLGDTVRHLVLLPKMKQYLNFFEEMTPGLFCASHLRGKIGGGRRFSTRTVAKLAGPRCIRLPRQYCAQQP